MFNIDQTLDTFLDEAEQTIDEQCESLPYSKNVSVLQRQAITKASDLNALDIGIEVLPVKLEGHNFDYSLFYRDLVQFEEPDFFGSDASYEFNAPAIDIDDLLRNVHSRQLGRHRLATIDLNFGGPDLTASVSAYCLVRRGGGSLGQVNLDAKDHHQVTSRRTYFTGDSANREIASHDRIRGVKIGERWVCFDDAELKQAMSCLTPIGIHLLGFKPLSQLKRHYHIRPAHFIYPNENKTVGSRAWFTTLLEVCLKRQLFAMAVYSWRQSIQPRIVALLPQSEVVDDQKLQIHSAGFHVIFLPYLDDVRDLDIAGCKLADPKLVDSAKKLIRKLNVPFRPDQIANPVIAQHRAVLEALALNYDSIDPVVDQTVPKNDAILKRAGSEIETFKELCGLRHEPQTKALTSPDRKRKATNDDQTPLDQLVEMASSGRLSQMTVPQLRSAAKSLNLAVSGGGRKADIVALIEQHLTKKA